MEIQETRAQTVAGPSIHPDTTLGAVSLRVGDLAAMKSFYSKSIGLEVIDETEDSVRLGIGGRGIVGLLGRPDAPKKPYGTTGLFHLALLVPDRLDLARAIRRVVDSGWSFTGASDHLVSEAMYLDDPEGNGIEIYRDRRRDEWRYSNEVLQMATLPLDIDSVLEELRDDGRGEGPVAPGTKLGHVHLQVSDLDETEAFYSGILGFDVMVRGYPGALFVSAGGYHHHIGLNTWAGAGAPPPPSGSRGLDRFEVVLPDAAELDAIEKRIESHGLEFSRDDEGVTVSDPSGNGVLLTSAES